MDVWIGGWLDGLMDWRMVGWTDGLVDGWMDWSMDRWRMDGLVD